MWKGVSSECNDNVNSGVPQIVLLNADISTSCILLDVIHSCQLIRSSILPNTLPLNNAQKHWLPFTKDDDDHKTLFVWYSTGPIATSCKLDLTTGDAYIDKEYETHLHFYQVRGSAPPIPYEDHECTTIRYIMLVHCSIDEPMFLRKYLYRFLFLDRFYSPVALSHLWNISDDKIMHIVLSMVQASIETFYITVGECHKDAFIVEYAFDQIKRLGKIWFIDVKK